MASVLTVDDSPSIRQAIKIALGAAGHEVAEAADGSEGAAKARAGQFNGSGPLPIVERSPHARHAAAASGRRLIGPSLGRCPAGPREAWDYPTTGAFADRVWRR